MTDEFIEILNEDLSVLKISLKSIAHKHGHLHASVHVWFYTIDGKILIQKRASSKIAFPNLWDVSVAGHVSADETPIQSAIREIKEEIGLTIYEDDLSKIGCFKERFQHEDDFIDNEIHHIYLCELKVGIEKIEVQKEEVSEVKLIPIHQFKKDVLELNFKKDYTPHYPKYYNFILENLYQQIKI